MFTWDELVCLGLIGVLKDPQLVFYFLDILKPLRRDFIEGEARKWHKSLRISQNEKCRKVNDLALENKLMDIYSSVPITCNLPFDGEIWRRSCLLLKSIKYFKENFIREEITFEGGIDETINTDQYLPDKIKTVNLIFDKGSKGYHFRQMYSIDEIQETLCDFDIFEEADDDEYIPFILVSMDNTENYGMKIIN